MHCEEITLKSGQKRWTCVADGPADPITGKRKQIWRRGKTKREAANRVKEAIRLLEMDGIDERVGKKMTFDALANEWIETYSLTGVKRGSVRIREKEIKILNKHIAKMPISEISHSKYQKLLNKLSAEYARNTVSGVHTTAGMIFKYAVKDKLIKDNPTTGAVLPKKRKTVEEIESEPLDEGYLTTEEVNDFLDAVTKHGLDLDIERFYLLAFTGMRSGELCALKWSDIDFRNNTIRITKTLYNEDNNMRKYVLTPPKTEGSIRTIEVAKEIMDLLKSHRKRQMKVTAKYREVELNEYHDGNFVFCRVNGYPFIQKNIINRMARILEFTNIQKNATPHIFRHTHISMLTEAGVDLSTIMERVGHDDMQTTLKIYTHVTKKMKKDASEKVTNQFGNILKNIIF
ncbi:site-specific integrase [Ureibacillus sp. Re31]|uniref:Site-specific integrase n=1 Tax=Ureibacillus galli TaxID=2762222 RepID=A0ABR8XAV5_9BACL|nr:tyrosine-type recombinase/integrase [Ureibacillus galli]MBD8026464.1 site-specific integrase [Ureibacillus galli]